MNEDKSIELKFIWSESEFLRASQCNYQVLRKQFLFRTISVLLILIVLLSSLLILLQGYDLFNTTLVIACTFIYFLRWPIYKFQLKMHFKKYAEKDKEVTWQVTDSFLKGGVEGLSQGEIQWDNVAKIVDSPEGFIIYRYPLYHWFPKDGFINPDDVTAFEALARKKIKQFEVIS